METICIHVFSGTGNTAHAAKRMAEVFEAKGKSTVTITVDSNTPPSEVSADFHLFMFPVYAMSVPAIMRRYLRSVPKQNGKPCAVISTHGEVAGKHEVPGEPGGCLKQARRMLQRRGYSVVFAQSAPYPHNVTAIIAPVAEDAIEDLIVRGDEIVSGFAQRILSQDYEKRSCGFFLATFSLLFGLIYNRLGRLFIGKFWSADTNCNGCGLCVRSCPNAVIRLVANRPRWNWDCMGCMRCQNVCAKGAIGISALKVFLYVFVPAAVLLFVYPPLYRKLPGELPGAGGYLLHLLLVPLLYTLLSFFLVALMERVIMLFDRIGLGRTLFSFSHTKKNRRYLCPGFKPPAM